MDKKFKAYKGMDKDMRCHGGYQYEIGKEYEWPRAVCCKEGGHACENPIDVFAYYPPATSRFFEVELSGEISREAPPIDTKVAATRLRVVRELSVSDFTHVAVAFACAHTRREQETADKQGVASATGWQGMASATGEQGAASATGWLGMASATGLRGAASATGEQGMASAGDEAGVAMAWGPEGRAKGVLGAHIAIAEWRDGVLVGAKMARVDGQSIKADTWYSLRDGEFVEADYV